MFGLVTPPPPPPELPKLPPLFSLGIRLVGLKGGDVWREEPPFSAVGLVTLLLLPTQNKNYLDRYAYFLPVFRA